MKILTQWLRSYLPSLPVDDAQLAEDLTLRGIAVEGVFPVGEQGSVFDMDITTNRVDAMNHYGIAREAAAIYDLPLTPLMGSDVVERGAGEGFPVRIDAPELCGRFTAQIVRDVTIGQSRGLIAEYFSALGLKQISNAVDISNFVLFGMGHPNHVFDLDKIDGGIVVRRAHAGETLKLLDGTTRTLVADDLVIADRSKAISLAGVMGGYDTMITAETKNILVEAAWFSPATIRATSRRHLIHTDASHRYERGADFAAAPLASALVAGHILEVCGGRLDGPMVDAVTTALEKETAARAPIQLSVATSQRILGRTVAAQGITPELIHRYLTALGCGMAAKGDSYAVTLPSWRLDLTREIDLIEEIARVYGYNGFANTLPTPEAVTAHAGVRAERTVRRRLLALGFTEAISSTFASVAECAAFAPAVVAVALENPLSDEAASLRPSLLPGMVTMLGNNLNRDVLDVRLFEAGTIFGGSASEVEESLSLALGITGSAIASNLYLPADAPFGELKGAIESLIGLFDAGLVAYKAVSEPSIFEPGRAATVTVDGKQIARFGELSRAESARRKLRQPVFLAEMDLEALIRLPVKQTVARELSRFQAVERDFSFTFPDAVTWGAILAALDALGIGELGSIAPVELWRDKQKYPGVYSTLIRTVFQSLERTLTDGELSAWSSAIVGALESLGGTLRS